LVGNGSEEDAMGVAVSPESNYPDVRDTGAVCGRLLLDHAIAQKKHAPGTAGGESQPEADRVAVGGVAEIGFALTDGVTRLSHLYEKNPLRVLFPAPAADDLPVAVLVTTSGGLVAGDRIDIAVKVREGAAAHVTGSAAEKIYRSTGAITQIDQKLVARSAGWLEFLPPEAILFDAARLRRDTRVELEGDAGFLGGGIIVFGRIAMGERFCRGLLHETWEVYRGGQLVWGDALHIGDDVAATMADPACFDGAEACATLILAPRQGEAHGLLDAARAVQRLSTVEGLRAGMTAVNGLLVARWLGPALPLRRAYAEMACHLRQAAIGLPARLPRLWHV
jgi:urease accessory protein